VFVPIPEEWEAADMCADVSDAIILEAQEFSASEKTVTAKSKNQTEQETGADPRSVFVIHGRDEGLQRGMFDFLRAIDLRPLEWSELIARTGKASPYVGEVLAKGFSLAQAAVVILSGDDEARLRETFRKDHDPAFESQLTPQARPNVILEAGMAIGLYEERTVLIQCGEVRSMSDLLGRHVLRMGNSAESRKDLAQRLETAGCAVNLKGTDWMKSGSFSPASPKASHSQFEISDDQTRPERADAHRIGGNRTSGSVIVRLGDVFDSSSDMVVLPCSAKGSISRSSQKHIDHYGIAHPLPMKPGDIQVLAFQGAGTITKWIAWAASVQNDHSTMETIEAIGAKLGRRTKDNPEVRIINVPLLGTGAGGLGIEQSAAALHSGFKSTSAENTALLICSTMDEVVKKARIACERIG
jgi:predicted nucleotide-binding protein